jgi:DNA adenine methylase Dam
MLQSPFNYTGSKYRLLSQLFLNFPPTEIIYDIFVGGGAVSLNVNHKVIANDIITPLIQFYQWLQIVPWDEIVLEIQKRNIPKDNKDKYLELRDRFNKDKNFIDFYILCCCCTNNMMRFNKKHLFNQTWGKRNFNPSTEQKLNAYHDKLYKNHNIVFLNKNFYDIEIDDGFVYLDPSYYFISEAGYNAYWSMALESKLYDFIDNLNRKGVKFVLSGVLEHKGKTNPFKDRMVKYDVVSLIMDYKKVAKKQEGITQEVIVKNF